MRIRSLQGRILVFVLVALAVVQTVVFIVVDVANTRWVTDHVREDLEVGGQVFQRVLNARTEQLAATARLLSGDFAFKAAYAAGDRETIRSALENQQLRIGADMMMIVDLDKQHGPGRRY
jgi:adenylate cyclase